MAKPFFKAPRYLLRKFNILSLVKNHSEIKSFIDVGCGAGELTCSLAERGLKGIGLDFSDDALKTANGIKAERKLTDTQVTFKKGSPNTLKTRYDLVIACEVLEHVKDDRKLLKELVTLSNNYVLISVPARMKYFDEFDEKVGHFRRYEKDALVQLLESGGLQVIDFRAYGYPLINFTRLLRKAGARFVKKQKSMEDSTKQSGINPLKLPGKISSLNIEPGMKPFYWLSLPFNRLNLSEGYLVLAKKIASNKS